MQHDFPYTAGKTVYGILRQGTTYWKPGTQASETYSGANYTLYATAASSGGAPGSYTLTITTTSIADGIWVLELREQIGGSPATTDAPPFAASSLEFIGGSVVNPFSANERAQLDILLNTVSAPSGQPAFTTNSMRLVTPQNFAAMVITTGGAVSANVLTLPSPPPSGYGSLTITPFQAITTNPRYSTRDIPAIAQGSAPTEIWTITDANGNAIDLSAKAVRLVAYLQSDTANTPDDTYDDTLAGSFKYETGGQGITIGGAGNNQVTLQHDAAKTAKAGHYRYGLWNVTDKLLLVKGRMNIEPMVFNV